MRELRIQPFDEAAITTILDLIKQLPDYLRCEALNTLLTTEPTDLVRAIVRQTLTECQTEAAHVQQAVSWHRQIGRG